jgi:hypothetical protein
MVFDKRGGEMESAADVLARIGTQIEKKREKRKHPALLVPFVDSELIRPEDLVYVHTVFLQCFLPLRHSPKNRLRWQADHGKASVVFKAGELMKPGSPNEFKQCEVPAGPKGRLIFDYIQDFARRHKTPEIDLGRNLHKAMETLGVKVGGDNGKALTKEVDNVAAAEIIIGSWLSDKPEQKSAKVSEDLSFWMERDQNQRLLWQPTMILGQRFYTTIRETEHMGPVYWPAQIGLQHNPRAMDIHRFLTYRLHNGLKRPLALPAAALKSVFGHETKQMDHFWPEFVKALKQAHKWYPTARVEVLKDDSGIKLYDSPPLIPRRKVGWIE